MILVCIEDSPEATVRPRLEAMGADLSLIHILDGFRPLDGGEPELLDLSKVDHRQTVRLPAGTVETADGRGLESAVSATVAGPPSEPLTASFSDVPTEHTGEAFTFGLTFSEDVAGLSYTTLRDAALSVTNGQVTRARRRTQGSNQGWTITVEPDSDGAVTVKLPAGSVETSDGRGLERAVSATVAGPVGIAVADARVSTTRPRAAR